MNHRISLMDPSMAALIVPSIIHHLRLVCSNSICLPSEKKKSKCLLDVLGNNLNSKTLCPSAQQYLSSHYNLHNMFGYFEAKASNE